MDFFWPSAPILILGASTRAAAFSARRAGLNPTCIDLFADRDLSDCCTVTRLAASDFPYGFARVARSASNGPWIYGGALENYPKLVDRISTDRPLWGNSSEVLRRVRDPFQLAECLGRVGLRYPAVRPISDKVPACASWLMKPIASAGGRGICQFTVRNAALRRRAVRGMYFQQQLEGQPYAAVFVADRRRAVLIGLTRQLIGEPSFHARPFHYCGSIGPLPIQRNLLTQLTRLGDTLTAEFGLLGLFGVDGMIIDGEFWVIEVNPRYTASVEILELGMELSVLSLHRDACTTGKLSSNPAVCATRSGKYIGKAILFAAETINVPDLSTVFAAPVRRSASRWSVPSIADIPQDGEQIPAGRPICTVFAIASSVNSCQCALTAAAQMVYEQLKVSPSCSRPA